MNAISSIDLIRKRRVTQDSDKRSGPVADAILSLRIMMEARVQAKMVLMDLTSYTDAIAHLQTKLAEEAQALNIAADFEVLAEHSLEDASRLVEYEMDELTAHLMGLALAMKAENAPPERIRAWVRSAANSYAMAFRFLVPGSRIDSVLDFALRETPPDDAEEAGETHLHD